MKPGNSWFIQKCANSCRDFSLRDEKCGRKRQPLLVPGEVVFILLKKGEYIKNG